MPFESDAPVLKTRQTDKRSFSLLLPALFISGCTIITFVGGRFDGEKTPSSTASSTSSVTTTDRPLNIEPSKQCGEIVFPEAIQVPDLPPDFKAILTRDPNKGLVLMAEHISKLRNAYSEYRTAVKITAIEYQKTCKK